jgi:hypothetical protein
MLFFFKGCIFRIFNNCFLINNEFVFLSDINIVLFIRKVVPSARLELALPKGQGF